ncbi:hypothetical protein [Streptomyces sp. NBC_01455]|uniref:hypothetical protein n=1 Tax=Streptomyces sp. NBC_01455 TaxID=2903874 RepID=UPI002E37013B|nr:hypothetical protein [Streptomyces sp. NBC_01455]
MHSRLRFENPPALPHEVVVETKERALRDRSAEGEAAGVLIETALSAITQFPTPRGFSVT